jgi:hypothetical protein
MPSVSRFSRAITPAFALFFLLATAADAGPAWRELGDYKDSPLPAPGFKKGCEETTNPPKAATCKAVARLTGYQTRFGAHKNPYQVNNRGKITAVTVRLGNPTKDQLKFFNTNFGTPTIRLSVLKKPKPDVRHHTDQRLVDQSEVIDVSKYLGSTPTFVLSRSLVVPGGPPATIALTVPTWAPVFTINRPNNETWRASTPAKDCGNAMVQSAHQAIGSVKFYDCSFKGARLLYHATFLRDPKQTKK